MMSSTSPASCEAFSPAFSRSAEFYDAIHAGKDYDGEAARVLELLGPVPERPKYRYCNLLDWGCGTGEFTMRFSAAGWVARGVDVSAEMVDAACRKGNDAIVGNMATLVSPEPWPAQTCLFAAFSYAAAAHPPLLILENFRKAAAPGGRLVFDFINADAKLRAEQRRDVDIKLPYRYGHRTETLRIKQFKRLVDSRLIENRIEYHILAETVWHELHYMRTWTRREMAELIEWAGWRLHMFANTKDHPGWHEPYYLTAFCTLPQA